MISTEQTVLVVRSADFEEVVNSEKRISQKMYDQRTGHLSTSVVSNEYF